MILAFNIVILSLALVSAIIALQIKDNLSAAIIFGTYSFLMCLAWTVMGAVDVAFTEATVGAGVSTVFFIATILRTLRRTSD
eukprot:COSAG06_NODE_1029_length_11018_cov_1.851923_5_plen_82_part_00